MQEEKRLGLKVLAISVALALVASSIVLGANPINSGIVDVQDETIIFDTNPGTYPSIPGEHKGNFTPKKPMNISKIYTYPRHGTGGHTTYIAFLYQNETPIGIAQWGGYVGDWHNLSFDDPVELEGNETYKYLIKTGSYPQIIHKNQVENDDGIVTCTEFTDANGKKYTNWIPAFKLFEEVIIPDTTPPGSVTDLNESELGQNYIKWNWANPEDPDFKGVKIYLNDTFVGDLEGGANVHNATGLLADTLYKIGLKPYDNVGNIGEWANDTARTSETPDITPPGSVTGLNESELGQSYIKWDWNNPGDPDFLKTMIYLNDQFLTNLTKTIAEYNATGLDPDTQYKLGIKTVDEAGNINQSIVEDLAKTLKLPANKTWAEMDFAERKALTEQFLAVDPTDYAEINQCLYIADALYQNATHAKELYGLEDDIPMELDYGGMHICNVVLLKTNKSDIEHWGFINMEDDIRFFDKNHTIPVELNDSNHIFRNGTWITPDELYRLTNYSMGFEIHWEPNQKPIVTIVPTYPQPYQDLYPA